MTNWEAFTANMPLEEKADFQAFIRCRGFGTDYSNLELMRKRWMKSRRRMTGVFERTINNRRWKEFGPGRFWGQTIACKKMNEHRRKMMGQ